MQSFTHISRSLHALFISHIQTSTMRCDLHVHSTGSGMCNTPGLRRICKESYSDPLDVYARCKRLGMSIVTVTDHDSIESAEALRKHADFFLSEEVTVGCQRERRCTSACTASRRRIMLEIQRRRNDLLSLLMYLTERKLFFSVNHVLSGLTGRREAEDFNWFASYIPAFEVRNGQMWSEANLHAERLARQLNKVGIAGSDSHTLSGIARTYTEVPGTRTIEEFFGGLRTGLWLDSRRAWWILKTHCGHLSIRRLLPERKTVDGGNSAPDRPDSGNHRRPLDERNPFLQAVGGKTGCQGKAAAHAVGCRRKI